MATDLTEGNILFLLLRFTIPLFLSNALQTVYNIVDTIVVGRFVGNAGLSAVSVCGDILNVLTFVAFGLSGAGQVLIAQYTGAGRRDKTSRLIGTMFSVLFSVAVLFTLVTFLFWKHILAFSNIPPEALTNARDYLLTYSAGLVFQCGYNAVSAILRGMGDSTRPFIFVGAAMLMNIVLNLVFVALWGLGCFGAAFATILSQGFSFIISIVYLYRRREAFGFDFLPRSFIPSKDSLLMLIKLGLPMAIQYGMIQLSRLIVTSWINVYGVSVSAITGIGNKFNSIGFIFSQAISTSTAAMIGQCIGAQKFERVLKSIVAAYVLSIAIGTILVVPVVTAPEFMFSIFTSDAEVLSMVRTYMPVVVIMLAASALRAPLMGLINGSENPRANFAVALTDGVVSRIRVTVI